MPDYHTQMEFQSNPDKLSIFEITEIDQLDYDDWIEEKRYNGKHKLNRISRNKKRSIRLKKQKYGTY